MKLVHGLIFGLGLGGLSAAVLGIADKHQIILAVGSLMLLALETKLLIDNRSV
ncbi:hypothetical protein [Emcibacter nanhaiensis]|uniref:hypothetical protein n=1 Tax=Emcibacter nanhaiensis TaxID=1505037 RepID=UPI0015E31004|nr:hypothetical protein [Emcibacter nanhaiensis]